MIDSKTPAQGVEMSTTPRLTSYTMCLNIMQICFGLFLVWLRPMGRATILEHITAAHLQCTCLALDVARSSTIPNSSPQSYGACMIDSKTPAQGVKMSTTPRSTSYTMCLNIMQIGSGLYLVWRMPSGRATILEHMTATHVHALHWMCQRLQLKY